MLRFTASKTLISGFMILCMRDNIVKMIKPCTGYGFDGAGLIDFNAIP